MVTCRKPRVNSPEQTELWSSSSITVESRAEAAVVPYTNNDHAIIEHAGPVRAMEEKVVARPAGVSRRIVTARSIAMTDESMRPARTIARFLTLNHAITGMTGDDHTRFEQRTENAFSRMFRFWKGSAPASSFSSVCF